MTLQMQAQEVEHGDAAVLADPLGITGQAYLLGDVEVVGGHGHVDGAELVVLVGEGPVVDRDGRDPDVSSGGGACRCGKIACACPIFGDSGALASG